MSQNRLLAVVLACCLITTVGMLGSVAVGPAAAQDDGVPSLPGVYYGELSGTDGSVDGPVLIEAVADGEVEDRIISEADGSFGGDTISDDALEVQEPDSGEVEFHIGGTPVEITSLEGDPIEDTTMPWDSGTQEVVLEADSELLEPDLDITITDVPETVEAGSDVTVEVTVDNAGPVEGTPDVELVNESGDVVATSAITVGIEESTDTSLTWTTEETADGNETLTVQASDSMDEFTVEIEPLRTPEIAPDPGDGDGQGVGGIPEADTGEPGTPDDMNGSISETQSIVNSDDFGLSQVRFSETAHVVAITWEGTDINGSVETITYSEPPADVDPAPGGIGAISEVTVPADFTDESAIVEQRVATERVDEIGANATELQGFRFTDAGWEPVPTTVGDQTDDEIIVESEVPGFSYLAVSAVGTPEAVIEADTGGVSGGDELTLSASESSDPYGELVRYEWTVNGETLTGESVTTTVEDTGDIEVELTVENDGGKTDTATQTVVADDSIPGFTPMTALVALLLLIGSLAMRAR